MRGQKFTLLVLGQRFEAEALDAHLYQANRDLRRTQLVKWCFVLARHLNLRELRAQYTKPVTSAESATTASVFL
jgi:hypothetical protein